MQLDGGLFQPSRIFIITREGEVTPLFQCVFHDVATVLPGTKTAVVLYRNLLHYGWHECHNIMYHSNNKKQMKSWIGYKYLTDIAQYGVK